MPVTNPLDTKWFTEKVMPQMNDDQRYCVALIAIKLIYSDSRVDKREIEFLPDLNQCLGNNKFLLYVFTSAANSVDLSKMPVVEFDKHLKKSVLEYLTQIAIVDQDLHGKEMALIKEIAKWLNYTPNPVSSIGKTSRLSKRWSNN